MNGHWVVSEHWSAARDALAVEATRPAPASATQALSLVQPVNGGTLCASVASEAGPSPTAPSCGGVVVSACASPVFASPVFASTVASVPGLPPSCTLASTTGRHWAVPLVSTH